MRASLLFRPSLELYIYSSGEMRLKLRRIFVCQTPYPLPRNLVVSRAEFQARTK